MKPIVITGASRGLGAAMAFELANRRAGDEALHLILVGKTVGALEEVDDGVKSRGATATLAPFDITDELAMRHLCKSIDTRWGAISGWIHAAIHATALTPTQQIQAKDLEKSIAVNVTATARLISYLTPLLGDRARVLFFDDPQAGKPFFGSYGSTKGAQIALARSWQAETVRTGPDVSVMTPDPMPTASRARFHPGQDPADLSRPEDEAKRMLASWWPEASP